MALINEKRPVCRRGVIWITKLCNIRCRFCYYLYEKNKKHTPVESVFKTIDWFVSEYALKYVDITGGEPSIHPNIEDIVEYSAKKGLAPTLITNGQRPDVLERLIERGLNDVLISIHAIGEKYDDVVQKKGAFKKIEESISLFIRKKFPFRTNTTLTKYSCEDIREIVDWLKGARPKIVNLIAFNPHEGTLWAKENMQDFQVSYSKMADAAKYAIDVLEKENIWVNVRYIPLCFMKGYEEHVSNFHQWQYDPYEWDCISGGRYNKDKIRAILRDAENFGVFGMNNDEKVRNYLMKIETQRNVFLLGCRNCANLKICDGIYPQYFKSFGNAEFQPKEGDCIEDPIFYRMKDLRWAK